MREFYDKPSETLRYFPGCRFGRGEQIRNIENDDVVNEIRRWVGTSFWLQDPTYVPLTPFETTHPVFRKAGARRGVEHHRSFQFEMLGKNRQAFSLNIKGGDFLNSEGVRLAVNKIKDREFPGAGTTAGGVREFDAALVMQGLAMEKLGRLTYTALPVWVREIKTIPLEDRQVGVGEFINSSEYVCLSAYQKDRYGVPQDMALGDFLLGVCGLRPAAYCYATEGLNIRANELPSLLYFDEANRYLGEDPLSRVESGLFKYGIYLAESKGASGDVVDETIRAVYSALGEFYGFDAREILPNYTIGGDNYVAEIKQIPLRAKEAGIAKRVLDRFVSRICEVAALGHSAGYVFSSGNRGVGGSLIPRNVTYAGVVLDWDTFGKRGRGNSDLITKDFGELLLSVACLRRLVTPMAPGYSLENIREVYLENVAKFSESRATRLEIERLIGYNYLPRHILRVL